MSRKVILALLMLMSSCTLLFAEESSAGYLVVETSSGRTDKYDFGLKPEIKFNGAAITIATQVESTEYAAKEVSQFYFLKANDNAIHSVEKGLSFRKIGAYEYAIEGVKVSDIKVCTLDGKLIGGCVTSNGDEVRINLSSQPKGIYIISSKSINSIKISKK